MHAATLKPAYWRQCSFPTNTTFSRQSMGSLVPQQITRTVSGKRSVHKVDEYGSATFFVGRPRNSDD
jgi:K+-transporting ATPase c subunit